MEFLGDDYTIFSRTRYLAVTSVLVVGGSFEGFCVARILIQFLVVIVDALRCLPFCCRQAHDARHHVWFGPEGQFRCEVQATLVVDFGSCMFKARFAGDDDCLLCSLRLAAGRDPRRDVYLRIQRYAGCDSGYVFGVSLGC